MLLAIVLPFTLSITSNLLRSSQTLFGLEIQSQRFYTFMGSPTQPWKRLWQRMWGMVQTPAIEDRVIVALNDSIIPKSGRKIFGCANFHDQTAKNNQSSYPWAQCIVVIGLLKKVKSRWVCPPPDFRFYMMEQATAMLKTVHSFFQQPVLAVTYSWFGNNRLWSRLQTHSDNCFNLLSRLRTNITLYDFPSLENGDKRKVGHPGKYGDRGLAVLRNVAPGGRIKLKHTQCFFTGSIWKSKRIRRMLFSRQCNARYG